MIIPTGPYAPAVLRFQISFPNSYPRLPPIVTFSTDIFHPLITPLTTYMYTTDIQDNGTVSATDEERLPPGGFSLRHGFPAWFGRGKRSAPGSRQTSGQHGGVASTPQQAGQVKMSSPDSATPGTTSSYTKSGDNHISAYDVLKYIRSAFDNEEVLDSVPLDAAGNPGAWHAWRTHRRRLGKLQEDKVASSERQPEMEEGKDQLSDPAGGSEKNAPVPTAARRPGEWNWDGVWEDRVKKGIASSLSEPVLYGGAASLPDELVSQWKNHKAPPSTNPSKIQFRPMEEGDIESVKENIRRVLGAAT